MDITFLGSYSGESESNYIKNLSNFAKNGYPIVLIVNDKNRHLFDELNSFKNVSIRSDIDLSNNDLLNHPIYKMYTSDNTSLQENISDTLLNLLFVNSKLDLINRLNIVTEKIGWINFDTTQKL